MITVNINCSRLDKKYLVDGKNGKYADLVLFENKNGKDQYDNDGFVCQGLPKEARDRGEKGPIIGNWRRIEAKGSARPAPAVQQTQPTRPGGTRY